MTGSNDRIVRTEGTSNDAISARIVSAKRRRLWKIVVGANVAALIAAIAGCLFMMKSQGVHADVVQMRDEVGESLTMMTLGSASEAVSRYIPRLIDTAGRWNRKFSGMKEHFRGLDWEINQVQAMSQLGAMAERWRSEMEAYAPTQRNEVWQKSVKARVVAEQKKWPNRTHKKGAGEWMADWLKELWHGIKHGFVWPVGVYNRTAEIVKGGRVIDKLGVGNRLRYIVFPYRLSAFTMLRILGIAVVTSAIGYLMCWLGLKSRFGWMSYIGLLYFLYLLMAAIFILCLEITK